MQQYMKIITFNIFHLYLNEKFLSMSNYIKIKIDDIKFLSRYNNYKVKK